MIERVAGCFGRGRQGLLRLRKKPFRTRRYLHHAFWAHGAGNIDLPPWWKCLLQTQEPFSPDSRKGGKSVAGVVASGLHDLFLELLYPVQTHALIRRLERATRSHQQAAQRVQKGTREYTSIAKNLFAGKATAQHRGQNGEGGQYGDTTLQDPSDISRQMAEDLLSDVDNPGQCDELWKLQQDTFEASQPLEPGILKDIFFLLSTSKRKIDLERSLALFETFQNKSPLLCQRAVKAALELGDLETAVGIHLEAAAINPGSTDIGTPDILSYAVSHGLWKLAIDTWYRLWQSKIVYYSMERDLWKEVDALLLRDLLRKTEEAADFAFHAIESSSSSTGSGISHEAISAAREFALAMAKRAFGVRGIAFRQDQYMSLLDKIVALSDSSMKIRLQAIGQLLSLKDREHFPPKLARKERGLFLAAIKVYRQLREDSNFVPPQSLLEELYTEFKELKNCSGMLMILEDWKKFVPTKISIPYYLNMARIAGESGQLAAVDQVFNSFMEDYPAEETPATVRSKVMNYSLRVHFKRADTASILERFDDLQMQHGLIPDTMSYNLIIMTFARVGDVDGAMDWFRRLQRSGLAPNPFTYTSIMAMFAKRGDLEAVQDIWQEVERNDIKPNLSMVDALVVAYTQDEKYKEAEELVEKAVEMDLEGPRTHMWNVLLMAHASRGELQKVSEIHNRMYSVGVAEDSNTYAALLLSLCLTGNVNSTGTIFNNVMPKLRIPRTVMHYAIMMGGCIREKNYVRVLKLYQDMLKKNLAPNTGLHNKLLYAAAAIDERDNGTENPAETELLRAREVLEIILKSQDPAELAGPYAQTFFGRQPIDQAFIASHYACLIRLYGLKASHTKVQETYHEYSASAKEAGKENFVDDPPALMLFALLTAHRTAGNNEEVERCWRLTLGKHVQFAKRSNASLAEPGWVLHSRRFIINPILREYMRHLNDCGRLGDMITVISDLRQAGYELHSPNWNSYVSYLARSEVPSHRYLAFEICERELMQNWPGWERLASTNAKSSQGSWWHMKTVLERENKYGSRQPYKRMVQYATLVQLAGVYSDAQDGSHESADDVSRNLLHEHAPVTADAVVNLPRLRDREQDTYLQSR